MDADMEKSSEVLGLIDKGLHAPSLEEKMELLVNLKGLFRANPIPYFINATVLRLLEAFRRENNVLRRFIVQILGECNNELLVVYSKIEITRRLIKISYSNDSLTRAFNLRLLATLCTVISENKRVHHLIMKSVDCEHKDERAAAVVAMNAFATVSKRFSEMALRKMREVVESARCSLRLKTSVVMVLAHVHLDDETVVSAVEQGDKLLSNDPNKHIACTIICALSHTVHTRRIAMPTMMDVLLRYMKSASEERALGRIVLRNMKLLAPAVDLFSTEVIQQICELGDGIEDECQRVLWLEIVGAFVKQQIRSVNSIIQESMMQRNAEVWSGAHSVQLRALDVFVSLYCLLPCASLEYLLHTAFMHHIATLSKHNSHKLYSLLSAFVCVEDCPNEVVSSLISVACEQSEGSFNDLLHFLVISSEIHNALSPTLFLWAKKRLCELDHISSNTMLARLLYAPGVALSELPSEHSEVWGDDPCTAYLVARTAMRNGHASVALPILQHIQFKCVNADNRLWLSSLSDVCKASINEFNMTQLQSAIASYHSALCTLELLTAKKTMWHCFWFAERYVDCMRCTLTVLRRVLSVRNFTRLPLSNTPPSVQWKLCASSMTECYDKWLCLLRHSYDADDETVLALQLKCVQCSVMCAALMWLIGEDSQLQLDACFDSLSSGCTSTNIYSRGLVEWAKAQLDMLRQADIPLSKRSDHQYMSEVMNVLGKLCCAPVFLPRYFFQQLKRTQFNLSVSPQSCTDVHHSSDESQRRKHSDDIDDFERSPSLDHDDSTLKVQRGSEVPFVLEASVTSSTHHIDNFKLNVTVTSKERSRTIKEWSENITAEETNCFKATVPYLPLEDCVVCFTVDFVDEAHRQWTSHSQAEVRIVLNDENNEECRRRPDQHPRSTIT